MSKVKFHSNLSQHKILKGYSSNLVLHFNKIGGLTRDRLAKIEAVEAKISGVLYIQSMLLVPGVGHAPKTYTSHNATGKSLSVDHPCLLNTHIFQNPFFAT